jgi:hypothetical protein
MSSNITFIKNKSEKLLYNNYDKSKIEGYEEEYECAYSPNKNKINPAFSSFSIKSDINEQNSYKKFSGKNIEQDDINNKSKDITDIKEKRKMASKKDVYKFADKLYSNVEHLDEKRSFKKKNASQFSLINMNKLMLSNNSPKNRSIQQTAIIEEDIPQKIKKKSLFHIYPTKIEEEKKNNNLKVRPSIVSKGKSSYHEKKRKVNNFESFFKLKAKVKNPPKVSYIDSIIKNNNFFKVKTFLANNNIGKVNTLVENNNLSKMNTFVENKNIKRGESIRTMQGFEKNLALSPEKIETKREEEKKIKIITKLNTIKIEENKNENNINTQIKEEDKEYEEENKKNKKFKWTQNFLCCLSSNCIK